MADVMPGRLRDALPAMPIRAGAPVPATTKSLARQRQPFGGAKSPFPLRNAEGLTWAEVRRRREAAAAGTA